MRGAAASFSRTSQKKLSNQPPFLTSIPLRPLPSQEKTSERSVAEIESRLRGHYDEYLRVTNEKAGVYRDIIIAEDYDPLKARSSNIRVTPKIRDPMKVRGLVLQ